MKKKTIIIVLYQSESIHQRKTLRLLEEKYLCSDINGEPVANHTMLFANVYEWAYIVLPYSSA